MVDCDVWVREIFLLCLKFCWSFIILMLILLCVVECFVMEFESVGVLVGIL